MQTVRGIHAWLGRRATRWLYEGRLRGGRGVPPPHVAHTAPWWRVMCLTGVDYFSTLGYQPGIAFLAAGALSPLATFFLVLLTLLGALPIYSRVAAESPRGEGSIAMLEHLLPQWRGKLFVLCLLGFVATDFIITITLSAADATAHIVENPFVPHVLDHRVALTLVLVALLGAVFLRGFGEAIGIAVLVVAVYLTLNAVVITAALLELARHPEALAGWWAALWRGRASPLGLLAAAALVFPKLALGLSGFETGVAVMPLVRGATGDDPDRPAGRIRHTRRLLMTAALIMSVLLMGSSLVTSTLIPAEEFRAPAPGQPGGAANGRALAYLAHALLGQVFGTVYDASTIVILWFAGASAMAGLLSVVPRYLPRYGMAPEWARARRPLVLVFTAIAFLVTVIFRADVDAQGGAYATGVLALITSAAVAVTLSAWRRREALRWAYAVMTLVFVYTTVDNVAVRPEGIKIAACFIAGIVAVSFASRALRSTELRVTRVSLDPRAERFIGAAIAAHGTLRVLANHRDRGDAGEYAREGREKLLDHHLPPDTPVVFLEVEVRDASEFVEELIVRGVEVGPHRVLRCESAAVPNALAAFLLYVRDRTGSTPHIYFGWTEGNPLLFLLKYVAFGQGEIAPVTREILRQAERDPARRPVVHVGG
jgi:hypothetical protein